jgi:predicted Rossmann fold flavoprotein
LNKTIHIIGAGASGLISSIQLAKKGFDVVVFEKNHKAGRKLLATGNGRCNISNKDLSLQYFHSFTTNFPAYAISQFNHKKFIEFFNDIGLNFIEQNNKIFPMSLQASSVVDILYEEAIQHNVKFVFDSFVQDIKYNNNQYEILVNDKKYYSCKLIIASGSGAMKKLGSSDSGYNIAQKFNHNIIKPFASLVQLISDDNLIHKLQGVKTFANIQLYINNKYTKNRFGDILFTSYGVSGDGILAISKDVAFSHTQNKQTKLIVDILPNIEKNKLINILEKQKKVLNPNKKIEFLLESIINKKLIKFIYKKANIIKTHIKHLTKKDILNIVFCIKNITINIINTKGFEYAEVVAGGVDVKDIDNKTMQSKLQKELYFCGEVLDVDGTCGGYNLHWAFASGFVLAKNIKF